MATVIKRVCDFDQSHAEATEYAMVWRGKAVTVDLCDACVTPIERTMQALIESGRSAPIAAVTAKGAAKQKTGRRATGPVTPCPVCAVEYANNGLRPHVAAHIRSGEYTNEQWEAFRATIPNYRLTMPDGSRIYSPGARDAEVPAEQVTA